MNKIGILAKITFLQNLLSYFIAKINPLVVHNISKYMIIKKVFFFSAIEKVQGDYFEFGVLTGSSFCHAIRCAESNIKYDSSLHKINFYGFDSFEGFGDLPDYDKHDFFQNENFKSNYKKVVKRVKKLLPESRFKLRKGFFENTLNGKPESNFARIIFIDCDTYSSTEHALNYIRGSLQVGTIIILDDYFAYKGMEDRGVYGAFTIFTKKHKLHTRKLFSYGMGGVVKIFTKI